MLLAFVLNTHLLAPMFTPLSLSVWLTVALIVWPAIAVSGLISMFALLGAVLSAILVLSTSP